MTNEELKKQQEQQNAAGSANLAAETEKNTQESGAVQQTQNYLQQLLQNKPSNFNSQYLPQLETLYDKVMNRDKFSYDVASDPLYQQYKNQYAQMGQLAMQDAVGNAAALTGGYGNSWATTAGNQAYQGYLQQLNDKVPELYQTAYAQYAQEGEDLQNQLALTADLYDNEYSKYMDDLNYMQTMQQTAYERALSLMQMGITPSDEILAQAGLTADEAKKIISRMTSGGGSGGGSTKQATGYTPYNAYLSTVLTMDKHGMVPSDELLKKAGITRAQYDTVTSNYEIAKTVGAEGFKTTAEKSMQNALMNLDSITRAAYLNSAMTGKPMNIGGSGSGTIDISNMTEEEIHRLILQGEQYGK